jgi:hypothetical protein
MWSSLWGDGPAQTSITQSRGCNHNFAAKAAILAVMANEKRLREQQLHTETSELQA